MDGPLPMAMEVASTRLPGLGSWEEDVGKILEELVVERRSRYDPDALFPCMLLLKERNSKRSRAEK